MSKTRGKDSSKQTDESQSENSISGNSKVTLTVAQAVTIISVALGIIMSIAYAIASYMQTRYIVGELKENDKKIEAQLDSLKKETSAISAKIDQKTSELIGLIKKPR